MEIQFLLGIIAIVTSAIAAWSKIDSRLDHLGDRLAELECFLEKGGEFRRRSRRPNSGRLLKLVYWLKKFRLPTHYVGVTELQKNGNPHLHLVFVGRRSPSGSWLVTPGLLDKILFDAVENFCVDCDRTRFKSAGRVEPVRSDAGRYLAKYLSKGNHNKALHRTQQQYASSIAPSSESAGELGRWAALAFGWDDTQIASVECRK